VRRKLLVGVAASAVLLGAGILSLSWLDLEEQRRSVAVTLVGELGALYGPGDDIPGFRALKPEVARCAPGRALLLVLVVEGTRGGIVVREARVERPAALALEEKACIEAALLGQLVTMPNAVSGRRWRLGLSVGSSAVSPTATPAR
jgi:hypothetical protein